MYALRLSGLPSSKTFLKTTEHSWTKTTLRRGGRRKLFIYIVTSSMSKNDEISIHVHLSFMSCAAKLELWNSKCAGFKKSAIKYKIMYLLYLMRYNILLRKKRSSQLFSSSRIIRCAVLLRRFCHFLNYVLYSKTKHGQWTVLPYEFKLSVIIIETFIIKYNTRREVLGSQCICLLFIFRV